MKLTEKQKRFADYYIETGNATEAYEKAYGCKRSTADTNGPKLLGNTRIKSYIDERILEKDSERIAKQDEILAYLTNVMRGKHREQTLRSAGEGVQIIADIDVGAKDRIKAAELLGKRYAMWTDNKNIEGNLGVTIVDDIDD